MTLSPIRSIQKGISGLISSPLMKCGKSDPNKHIGPFKLLRIESDGLRVIRRYGCGNAFYLFTRKGKPKRQATT
jgi:hypothetical protein